MKKLYILFLLTILFACKQAEKGYKDEASYFEAIPYKNRAFVLSDSIRLYDHQRVFKQAVTATLGKLINIDSISIIKFYSGTGDTICELYNLIKISSSNFSGWAYGKDIFEFNTQKDESRDTAFKIGQVDFRVFVLSNFGVKPIEDEGLTFCSAHNPIALYNSLYDRLDIVPVSDSGKFYKSQYLSLNNSDNWVDQIQKINFVKDVLTFGIQRDYQEGRASFDAVVKLLPNKANASIINYSEYLNND
jgi:hypothetical protein